MRILLIGGTSFMGPHVVRALVNLGHTVAVFHRGQTNRTLPIHVEHIIGERSSLSSYSNRFEQFAPDVVLDMIGSTEEEARDLLNTFEGIAQRIVAISSQDVYAAYGRCRMQEVGDLLPIPITESSRLRERLYPYQDLSKAEDEWCNKYDKILMEQVIMGNSKTVNTVLRLAAIYGPNDLQHRFFSYLNLKRMIDKRPYILLDESFANWRWTHDYVENAAQAIVTAVLDERAAGKIYNVGEANTPTMLEFAMEIGKKLGWKGEMIAVAKDKLPEQLRFPLDTAQQLVVDSSLIRTELGFQENLSWEEGLARTIQWEAEHMPDVTDPKFKLQFDYELEDEVWRALRR